MSGVAVVAGDFGSGEGLEGFFQNIHECRDKNYATHGLHPYPAKFIPHIPRELIRAYSEVGDTVWDPMCGSGTALVEASIAGRAAIGGDLNPIAVLTSRAKTVALDAAAEAELEALARDLLATADSIEAMQCEPPQFRNRDHWFDPQVSRELAFALDRIRRLESKAAVDLASCVFSAIIVAVSNQESETRWSAKREPVVVGRALIRLGEKIREAIQRVHEYVELAEESVEVRLEDARESTVEDESIDLVVTSPPYANSHDYYLYNKLRMFWLDYQVRPVQDAEIGSRHRHSDRGEDVETYLTEMEGVLSEVHRGLVSGGRAVIVVADAVIRKQLFKMDELLTNRAIAVGLEHEQRFAFDHRRFNAAFQRGFGTSREKKTHVLVFRKGERAR